MAAVISGNFNKTPPLKLQAVTNLQSARTDSRRGQKDNRRGQTVGEDRQNCREFDGNVMGIPCEIQLENILNIIDIALK